LDVYLFKTQSRLAQAKEALYAYILEHGRDGPQEPREERAFQAQFADGSPLHAAMSYRFQNRPKGTPAPVMTYLFSSIYRSEVEHGVTDHFDDRLVAFGAMVPLETAPKSESSASDALVRRGWVWGLSKLAFVVALLAVAWLTVAEWNDRRIAQAQIVETTSALDQSLARVAQELPPYYFACLTDGPACSDTGSTAALVGVIDATLVRFDQTLLVLNEVKDGLGPAAIFGVTSADECSNTSRTLALLCQSRQRFFERRNCLRLEADTDPICTNHTTLGIAGTRFEDLMNSDRLAVSNVFSRPVALLREIEQLFELSEVLRQDPGFGPFWQVVADRAETCCLSRLRL
tara:strand:- start:312 stop:1349 length:1038 start_codon:yes stop_codon:yes gene_type:complete